MPRWKSVVGGKRSCILTTPFCVNPSACAGFTQCEASIFFFYDKSKLQN